MRVPSRRIIQRLEDDWIGIVNALRLDGGGSRRTRTNREEPIGAPAAVDRVAGEGQAVLATVCGWRRWRCAGEEENLVACRPMHRPISSECSVPTHLRP